MTGLKSLRLVCLRPIDTKRLRNLLAGAAANNAVHWMSDAVRLGLVAKNVAERELSLPGLVGVRLNVALHQFLTLGTGFMARSLA